MHQYSVSRARKRKMRSCYLVYAERRDQQRYGGHKININIGGSNAPTMSEALAKEASALLAQISKDK